LRALDVRHANDDDHFMLFTADNYGPVESFFDKLKALRARNAIQEVKPYDQRKYMPYKGNVRKEDIMTQGTQGLLGERQGTAWSFGSGVIKFRKIVLDALKRHCKAHATGLLREIRDGITRLDTAVGVRPKAKLRFDNGE